MSGFLDNFDQTRKALIEKLREDRRAWFDPFATAEAHAEAIWSRPIHPAVIEVCRIVAGVR